MSDILDSDVRRACLRSYQYSTCGSGSKAQERRLALFGKKASAIRQAFDLLRDKKMGLPCYSSTASVNREVEKQNDVMLSQIMTRHYQMVAQLLGSMQSVMTPPQVKSYFAEVVIASNILMKKILNNFGQGEVERLVPDPLKNREEQPQQGKEQSLGSVVQ